MSNMLSIENVVSGYDQADVLTGVSLEVPEGQITCLLGSNGAGKTTLIRAILGLTPARSGAIRFGGRNITREPTHRIAALGITCIPEGRRVFPGMSVLENLRAGAYIEKDRVAIAGRFDEVFGVFP
jgi:branched-chain amino acid transport system ATP-binding protein